MPLGKADGGRDALNGTAVYQVKFAGDPGKVRNSVGWLLKALDQEADKIRKLAARGAKSYYLVTNVGGTGHLDAGSIDRLDHALKSRERAWSIIVTPWWRETVDAQMSAAPNPVARAFPRVLPPDQVLALAAMSGGGSRRLLQVGVVPPRASAFQARGETEVIEGVLSADEAAVPAPIVSPVLSGLGGVGKTQLAADYVHSAVQRGALDLLVWITASSRDVIISAYAEAAALVMGSSAPGSAEQAAARLLAWLATTTWQWLVVLDDLNAPALLTGIWPPSSDTGRTIITTRRADAALLGEGRRMVEVGVFTPAEAATFVRERLADAPSLADDIDGVADDLGRLPLALSHAAAFMADRRMTCAEYRGAFADRERHLADLFPEAEALPDQYERTIAVTWSLSVDAADALTPVGLARPLLQLASVLDPDGIPAGAFTAQAVLNWLPYARVGNDVIQARWQEIGPDLARQGLHCLRRLSLVSADAEIVRVHRLVQRATREGLDRERICDLMWAAADSLLEIWPEAEDDLGLVRMLRANADALSQHDPDALWQPERHLLVFRHADSLADTGNAGDAIAAYEWLFAQAVQRFGPDDPDTFKARHELARLRGKAGNPAGAVEELRRLTADQIRALGPYHADVFTTRANLGIWLMNSGDITGSVGELQQLLDDATRMLGSDNPVTIHIRGNLLTARAQGEESADPIGDLERLLAEHATTFGLDHPDTLATRVNLADLRGAAGDHARAIADLEHLLLVHRRLLGPEHPYTLDVRQSIAIHSCKSGELARGAAELEQLIADRIRILGPEHLTILHARQALSTAYAGLGDSPRAIHAYQELLNELLRIRNPDDTEILIARQSLASERGKADDRVRALDDLERVHTDQVRILGPGHPCTLTCRRSIAALRCDTGDPASGADELEQLLSDQIRILGPDHPDILATRRELAAARDKLEHPGRALAAYESLTKDLTRLNGPCHPDTLHARRKYALRLGRSGQAARAITELEQLLPEHVRTLGADHPETLLTRQNLANRRAEIGDTRRSRAELGQLLADQVRVLGPSHRDTLITRSNLARAQTDAGDHIGAINTYEQLHQEFVRAVGTNDEDTLIIEMNLVALRIQAGDLPRAVNELEKLITRLGRLLGADHRSTLGARSNLAVSHAEAGNMTKAAHELEQVLKDQTRVLGAEDPETIATRRNLAALNGSGTPARECLLCILPLQKQRRLSNAHNGGYGSRSQNRRLPRSVTGEMTRPRNGSPITIGRY
jgi:tetratricopeptide (TPR) repeat protein